MNLLPDKQLFTNFPFQSTKYRKKEMCVDNKVRETIGDVNIPFKDQKPTIMLFGGDGTHCFARKTGRDYDKEKLFPFLKKFLRQSQPSTPELEPKKVKMSPNME